MFDTSSLFTPGKVTVVLDGGAGSSGKGKIGAFLGEHALNWTFACQAFMANAAHWVVTDDGKKYLYQSLNSVAHLKNKYQKTYICGGAVLELPALLREIKEHDLGPEQLGIHPIAAVVQDKDMGYERGTCDFDGKPFSEMVQSDCMKLGSTLHGVGAARARRILRRSDVLVARDIPELKPYICWTDREIMARLEEGQAGLLEVAQGFQLSYLSQFYPKCLHGSTLVDMADGTRRMVKHIKIGDAVVSKSPDGSTTHRRVTKIWRGKLGNRKWMRIETPTTTYHRYDGTIITSTLSEDHPVITQRGEVPVCKLTKHDRIFSGEYAIHDECMHIILGSMLGDGSICDMTKNRARSRFEETHGADQREYLEAKADLLKPFIGGRVRPLLSGDKSFKPGVLQYRYESSTSYQLREFAKSMGCLGKKHPNMTHIIDYINASGLAIWYQDDGCYDQHHQIARRDYGEYNYDYDRVRIATHGFTKDECEELTTAIRHKFGINFSCYKTGRYYYLHLKQSDNKKWFDLIAEFIHPTMAYKLPDDYRSRAKWGFNKTTPQHGTEPIVAVREIDPSRVRSRNICYDIEVEGDHNFFVGNGEGRSINVHNCTSRNCSVSAGLDDCCLPPHVVGDVVINFRTFPIRVNSNKYVHANTGRILNAEDMQQLRDSGRADLIRVLKGDSGGCYADQREITWDEVTEMSGIKAIDPARSIREITSLTKLERRVYTFSKQNMLEAVRFNRGNGKVYISVNFINYVDASLQGQRGVITDLTDPGSIGPAGKWLQENILDPIKGQDDVALKFVGTGAKTDDMLMVV